MVKIPGLDDLKKVGSDLFDSAKTIKMGDMVDKFKSGMEAVGFKKSGEIPQGDEAIKAQFEALYVTLKTLQETQNTQAALIKKVEGQVSDLAKILIASQPPSKEETNKTL